MSSIATIGPVGSDCYQAACQYDQDAELLLFRKLSDTIGAFSRGEVDYALIPVYNTREGEVKEYFRLVLKMEEGYWIDNVVLPIHLSLGCLANKKSSRTSISTIVGRGSVFKQCEEYIEDTFPDATLMAVQDIEQAMIKIRQEKRFDHI